MKPSNFLLVALLLLAPCELWQRTGPRGAAGDYATNYAPRKKPDGDCRSCFKTGEDSLEQLPVKIRYEPTEEEKCVKGKRVNVKEEELCQREVDAVKEAAAKWQSSMAEKTRQQTQGTCGSADKVVKVDFKSDEFKCGSPAKKGNVLCADCEQCELQVKANGEGVLLKCSDCREVSSNDVIFPAGNNRKIIRLP